jgi:hypothetical protein
LPVGDAAQASAAPAAEPAEANTDSFFSSFVELQCGHFAPFQRLERTRISLSQSHFRQ